MFLKLFKYDFRTTARFGVPVLIAIAAAGLLGVVNTAVTVSNVGKESTFEAVTNAPFGELLIFLGMGGLLLVSLALSIAASVMAVLLLVQFYRSTVSDEAYLTFTLPVTAGQILGAKLANTLVWSCFTGLALGITASAILGTGVVSAGIGRDFVNTFAELFAFLDATVGQSGLTVVLACLLGAASFVSSYLMLFMAITFGSAIARRHKALASVAMIFVIHFVMSGVTAVMQFILLGDFTIKSLMDEGLVSVNIYLIAGTILYMALSVVYFLVTRYMMDKKLNLD